MREPGLDKQARQRTHAERMLARAERRLRQAARLVDKWKLRLAALDRAGLQTKQARLWADEPTETAGEDQLSTNQSITGAPD